MIKIKQLCKKYISKNREVVALNNIELQFDDKIKDSYSLIYGRMPKKENEILVSYDFAIENYLLNDEKFI